MPLSRARMNYRQAAALPTLPLGGGSTVEGEGLNVVFSASRSRVESRLEFLSCCLVGKFDSHVGSESEIAHWATRNWKTSVAVTVRRLPESKFLFILPSPKEVDRVFKSSINYMDGIPLSVSRWDSCVSCVWPFARRKRGRWLLIKGLPLHLWCSDIFKAIGDFCGGFVAVDENWGGSWEFVRINVREGGHIPVMVDVNSGRATYKIQLIEDVGTTVFLNSNSRSDNMNEDQTIDSGVGGGARNKMVAEPRRGSVIISNGRARGEGFKESSREGLEA